MVDNERLLRHKRRMQRKKAVVDEAIANANQERGVVLVLTGNGKGKSSSAFGMVARALGHGMKVGVAQFIKARKDTGDVTFFRLQPDVAWYVLGEGFTWETQDLRRDIETAQKSWTIAKAMLTDPDISLVVLDELTYLLKHGWLELSQVLEDIRNRPSMQHVVVTGRGAPGALCDAADTVTDFADIKHAFRAGVKAQLGIDL